MIALALVALLLVGGCAPQGTSSTRPNDATESSDAALSPTMDDGVSPSYRPDAPVRESVGTGHVLTGIVRSTDGSPLEHAQIELWPEYAGEGHPEDARATVVTDARGRYRFECNPPEHIHMRVSAPGHKSIGLNSYHPDGAPAGTLDIVLEPESP